eukprot:jgi/Psemu1/6022/gm1.6022_g
MFMNEDCFEMFLAVGTAQLFLWSAAMWIIIITLRWMKDTETATPLLDQKKLGCCDDDDDDDDETVKRGSESNVDDCNYNYNYDCDRTIETCGSLDSEDWSRTQDEHDHEHEHEHEHLCGIETV